MRIFKNKWFVKFAKKEKIDDEKLCGLINEIVKGNVDVDYGGGVIKQRLARLNQGKSSGYRCIILYHHYDKYFFVYGFPKNERENISKEDEKAFKALSQKMLQLSNNDLEKMLQVGILEEVIVHEKN